jgi:hypothetical protein
MTGDEMSVPNKYFFERLASEVMTGALKMSEIKD